MKITTGQLAFTLESIAHLNPDPRLKPYEGQLLLAACAVRKLTDNQLAEALEDMVNHAPIIIKKSKQTIHRS